MVRLYDICTYAHCCVQNRTPSQIARGISPSTRNPVPRASAIIHTLLHARTYRYWRDAFPRSLPAPRPTFLCPALALRRISDPYARPRRKLENANRRKSPTVNGPAVAGQLATSNSTPLFARVFYDAASTVPCCIATPHAISQTLQQQ